MAPEQLDWLTTSVDYRAVDVWAFGVVAYVLCVGKLPWASAHESCAAFAKYKAAHTAAFASLSGESDPVGSSLAQLSGLPGLEGCDPAMAEVILHTLDPLPTRRWSMARVCEFLEQSFP